MGLFEPSHLIWIFLAILVLFGGTKIPQLMRGVGQGMGELQKGLEEGKKSMKKHLDEAKEPAKEETPASTPKEL